MKIIAMQRFHARLWRITEDFNPLEKSSVDPQPRRSLEWQDNDPATDLYTPWHTDESWKEETNREIPQTVSAWASAHGVRTEAYSSSSPSACRLIKAN